LIAQQVQLIHKAGVGRSPDAEVLGMSHSALLAMNPRLVHVSVGAYGSRGPMRDNPGYDLLLQAFTGIMQITGEADGPPNRAGVSVVDLSTGMIAFGFRVRASASSSAGTEILNVSGK